MLSMDSLVYDLIFVRGEGPEPETLIEALGGQEAVAELKVLDPDMQDPRLEMQISPSRPFRRQGERRLLIIDDSVAPLREDPEQPLIEVDLRPAVERLGKMCDALEPHIRMGRLFALGSLGEAVTFARSAVDMRGWALLSWLLSPVADIRGRPRSQPLSEAEFEEKLGAYGKRIEELTEQEVIDRIHTGSLTRSGEWLVLTTVDSNGHWDLRHAAAAESELAAVDSFSVLPGAPAGGVKAPEEPEVVAEASEPAPEPEPAEEDKPALTLLSVGANPLFLFPTERFDLGVATTLGKGDWQSILTRADADGPTRDRVFEFGAGFVAPLEFLSEVFIAGKPLSKPVFEDQATTLDSGAKALEVHVPRFGPALLIVLESGKRFITSEVGSAREVANRLTERA